MSTLSREIEATRESYWEREQSLVPSLVAERGHRVDWRIELATEIGRPPPFDVLLALLLP